MALSLPRLRRLPIVARAPLAAAAMTALVGLVASWLVLAALAKAQDERLRELVRLHVTGLSVALGPAVTRQDVWEVFDTLERAAAAGGPHRLALTVVADRDGAVLAASDPRRAPIGSDLAAVSGGAQALGDLGVIGAERRIRVLAPLTYQDRRVGAILTELDVEDLLAERRQAVLLLLVGNALATAALSFAGYLLMRRALRPVARLAERMSSGDGAPAPFDEAEVPAGDTEVARLFRTYNALSGAVVARAEAERRLAERERLVSLGRLASSLAHEINNPLGGLLNAADTLQTYADRPEVVRDSAALIERGLRRLRDVARATLDHNRLDDDAAPLDAADFDDLRLLVTPEIARLAQRLDWRVGPGAPAGLPAAKVRQIALNLLLNASAAAGQGGWVGFAAASDPQGVSLWVRDDGPGLAPGALARLISPGPLAASDGLGLCIVRDLTLAMGGEIAHRRDGGVTEIAVRLPRRAAAA